MAIINKPLNADINANLYGEAGDAALPQPVAIANLQTHALVVEPQGFLPSPEFSNTGPAAVVDFEGLVKMAKDDEIRFAGARRVENLITASEDLTDTAYGQNNGASVTATQATFDGTSNGQVFQAINIVDDGSGAGGRTFVYTANISLVSGTVSADNDVRMIVGGSAMTIASIGIGSDLTSVAQRFSITASTDAAGTQITPQIQCDAACAGC